MDDPLTLSIHFSPLDCLSPCSKRPGPNYRAVSPSVMKSLFTEVKKEPMQAGVFKFAFKLGFEEQEPIAASTTKKNKNKKKKKKKSNESAIGGSVVVATNDEDNDDEDEEAVLTEMTDTLQEQIGQLIISDETITKVNDPKESVEPASSVLSKSQKKNLKKKKAKKAGGGDDKNDGSDVDTSKESPTAISNVVSQPKSITGKSVQEGAGDSKVGTLNATKLVPKKDDTQVRKEALLKAQQIRAMLDLHDLKQFSAGADGNYLPSTTTISSRPPAPATGSRGSGPHFLSPKDPELDEASRLRYRYGMGRNLVAIGPAKVRDPNWLPPPPGLTKKVAAGASAIANAKGSAPPSPCKRSIAITKTKTNDMKSADVVGGGASLEGSHTSPFSFSFNGL